MCACQGLSLTVLQNYTEFTYRSDLCIPPSFLWSLAALVRAMQELSLLHHEMPAPRAQAQPLFLLPTVTDTHTQTLLQGTDSIAFLPLTDAEQLVFPPQTNVVNNTHRSGLWSKERGQKISLDCSGSQTLPYFLLKIIKIDEIKYNLSRLAKSSIPSFPSICSLFSKAAESTYVQTAQAPNSPLPLLKPYKVGLSISWGQLCKQTRSHCGWRGHSHSSLRLGSWALEFCWYLRQVWQHHLSPS